jgi:predicted acylesterase/phospholipase RssA
LPNQPEDRVPHQKNQEEKKPDPPKRPVVEGYRAPVLDCDLVMKGGITSGVIYPTAVAELAREYRLHGVGGSSAGAIGASLAAAAESGRYSPRGGFESLVGLPAELSVGHKLRKLFQPHWTMGWAFVVLRGVTEKGLGRLFLVVALLPGLFVGAGLVWWAVATGADASRWGTVGAIVSGVLATLLVVGVIIFVELRFLLPHNMFGIVRGLRTLPWHGPGLTDWLSEKIDTLAGGTAGTHPVTFQDLIDLPGPEVPSPKREHPIHLRMVASCLSLAKPFEFPLTSKNFFFERKAWEKLFPTYVISALVRATSMRDTPRGTVFPPPVEDGEWNDTIEDQQAFNRGLFRLPIGTRLPVIVAVRMSLSFPMLLSAVPLWKHDTGVPVPVKRSRANRTKSPFRLHWFMDGGLCSNFPLNLFEEALPTKPTFAINLGRFDDDSLESFDDESKNVVYAQALADGARPPYRDIGAFGRKTVPRFAASVFDTMRNWQDNSFVTMPGYRDRIVQILQSKREGGLNLSMDRTDITRLANRGAFGAAALAKRFRPYAPGVDKPPPNGWEIQIWTRYRSLLAVLPSFLSWYKDGRKLVQPDLADDRFGYPLKAGPIGREEKIRTALEAAAAAIKPNARTFESEPKSAGKLRRVSTF